MTEQNTQNTDAGTTQDQLAASRKARKAANDKARRAAKKAGLSSVSAVPNGADDPKEEPKTKPVKVDPRIVWPSKPESGRCASAESWHVWQSKCGRFQVARIVHATTQSGFSCQFRASALNGNSWELIAFTKEGPTHTRLFKTLRECLEAVEVFAIGKLGHGSFNMEQCISEAQKMGMADVPATVQKESKPSGRVAEEPTIIVPSYEVKENTVKITRTKAVEILNDKEIGAGKLANAKHPLKTLAKNLNTLHKMEGIDEVQLENDENQEILTDLLKQLKAGKAVEVVEDAPAKKGGKGKAAGTAKASSNGEKKTKASSNGKAVERDALGAALGSRKAQINAALSKKTRKTLKAIKEELGIPGGYQDYVKELLEQGVIEGDESKGYLLKK